MTRRSAAAWLTGAAIIAAAVCVVMLGPIERREGFHDYADQRRWFGIPHAGDVLSNLALIGVALRWLPHVPGLALAVASIGVGSAIYHWAPSDTTLALDWAPIGVTLMLVLAAVVHDRVGARAGRVVHGFGPLAAVLAVGYWVLTGGTTDGGNMAPYVALQLLGVALPPLLALVAPGRIAARYLLAAVVCFVTARVLGAHDAELLELIAISGHSLKHVAAAAAAACVLRACRA
ncbi:MAG: hypothetical protein H0T42_08205 [Deltaproteobacteria bacterium]|nr:hypothetical protein [Deltaproteobacteria bacterium]